MIGCARAFEMPTAHSLVPALVPAPLIARAVGGLDLRQPDRDDLRPGAGRPDLYALSPMLVGGHLPRCFSASRSRSSASSTSKARAAKREPPTFASVLAGFEFIRTRRRLLGVITLDLFVVLLGGATALLPIYRPRHSWRSGRSGSACCARRRRSAR